MASRLVTTTELLEAPTGVDWATVAENAGATSPAQAIEQGLIIDRAVGWMSAFCRQRLDATTDIETALVSRWGNDKAWVGGEGYLWFHSDYFPILSVTSLQWAIASAGVGALTWNQLVPANLSLYGELFRVNRVIDRSQDWTWLKYSPGLVQLTYVNGWPNAVLTAGLLSGAGVTATVDTTLGMTATPGVIGNSLTIYDGAATETVTVQSVTDATHVVLNNVNTNHNATIGISALPQDAKWAAIMACVHFARQRGTDAIVMGGGGGGGGVRKSPGTVQSSDALEEAKRLLERFQRII